MCDVMPTIAEDNISQRSSQFSGEDANFEQLMVSMLDERDKLMDSLREAQERLNKTEGKLNDTEKERDSLQRQINANLPQVRVIFILNHLLTIVHRNTEVYLGSLFPCLVEWDVSKGYCLRLFLFLPAKCCFKVCS